MKKLSEFIVILIVTCLILSLIVYPQLCLQSAKEAIVLCVSVVIPSLFPFFVCSGILIEMGIGKYFSKYLSRVMLPLFNVSGSGALAFTLGIISGYPLGAKCAADLYASGECDKTEAERLLAFCNNSGPLFILGAIGAGMLHNPHLGRIIYISHILSSVLVGICFRFYKASPQSKVIALPVNSIAVRKSMAQNIGESVYNSVRTMLNICGFIIMFAVLAAILPSFGTPVADSFVHGILEISGGAFKLAQLTNISLTLKISVMSFIVAFSGICVTVQVMSVVSPYGLSMKPYIFGKLLQGVFSFAITYFMCHILPVDTQVFLPSAVPFSYTSYDPMQLLCTSVLSVICCVAGNFIFMGMVAMYNRAKRGRLSG